MDFLKSKLKKFDKYVIEIENDEIDEKNFENIEDVIIISKQEFENELNKTKELNAKIHSNELEIKLKELKMQEKELEVQKMRSVLEELEFKHESELKELQNVNVSKINEFASEKELEIQKMREKMHELEESYKSKINEIEQENNLRIDELTNLFNKSEENASKFKEKYMKIKNSLENENISLQEKLKEQEELKKQIEVYKIGNSNLKRDIQNKKDELNNLKDSYNKLSSLESQYKKEILTLQSRINELNNVQIEYNKLENKYRHLQEVTNKKDNEIIELESKKRKLEQYLSMSLEAINTLKNLGLFNRLFNRVPEGIYELQEDIKKLQPPKEIEIDPGLEIEPVRAKSTKDILGEKE